MAEIFWLAPVFPAMSALALFVFGGKLSRRWISFQSCLAVLGSLIVSSLAFFGLPGPGASASAVVKVLFPWIQSGAFSARGSMTFDPLAAVMCLVVTGVGLLIHIYSAGYMAEERSPARYFGLLNLFVFFMLILVLASNIVLMFVGWEGVGLSSFLLIGFWFERPAAAAAGAKAFIVNRIGDAAFLVGLLMLVSAAGSAEFPDIASALGNGTIVPGLATTAAVLLFVGATGKSAQIPLYIWLPDAMEGPTPVSALIHAATMVTAGVYMVCRMNFLYSGSATASFVVGLTGAATAIFAASMALTENDIKRVLAYSTISQIGYMFIGCGVGAYAAGMFHLVTHAFFKSLLFLCAGSVIHALGGVQDLSKMGGLRKRLPRTFPAFAAGAVALAGIPFFSGFFSKDAILARAFAQHRWFIYAIGLITAVLTAFYMFRLLYLVFYGRERLPEETAGRIHESPPLMTVPMAILAFFALTAGLAGLPGAFGARADRFGRFLEGVLPAGATASPGSATEVLLMAASTLAALVGVVLAREIYLRRSLVPGERPPRFPRVHQILSRKYFVDEAVRTLIIEPVVRGSASAYRLLDLRIIDGAINGAADVAGFAGKGVNILQTGFIKDYALVFLAGAVLFLGILLF
jgi:NADH-quinone oxidoreductase subunit L